MTYYIARTLPLPFDKAVEATIAGLQKEGFGVLTDIDVAATMKKKLNVDVTPYRILGACNPSMAHEALKIENKLGVMLPCNVIVRDAGGGKTEVAAVDPVVAMQRIGNPALAEVAGIVRGKLAAVIEGL